MYVSDPRAVRLWLIRTDAPAPVVGRLATVLDDDERRRAGVMVHDRDRDRFTVAHAAVRLIVAAQLGVGPAEIRWRFGPNGKPSLEDGPHLNLSHSGGLALLALSWGRGVGVDVQRLVSDVVAVRMAVRYYPPDEARYVTTAAAPAVRVGRFARLWTRKEACVKSGGGRLMQGLRLPVRGVAHSGILVREPDGVLPGPYVVRDVAVPPGFRAAVALEGTLAFRISLRRWVHRRPIIGAP